MNERLEELNQKNSQILEERAQISKQVDHLKMMQNSFGQNNNNSSTTKDLEQLQAEWQESLRTRIEVEIREVVAKFMMEKASQQSVI